MTGRALLVGGGGHCRAVIDVLETAGTFRAVGIVDRPGQSATTLNGLPVVGTDDDLAALAATADAFVLTIGQIISADARARLGRVLATLDTDLPAVVSPRAHVSARAALSDGVVVLHAAVVNAGASIGVFGIVNTGAIVEHDVIVGDYCHVSTGAIVNGAARIGDRTFVGSNSVIREGLTVGSDVVVGAGAVVVRDVRDGETVTGLVR